MYSCSCKLEESVIVGNSCKMMENVKITKSVIGRNVELGKNVCIESSFIFNNAVIEDNCTITHSIISYNARVQSNSKITTGSVIGTDVILPKDSFIENSIIQSTKPLDCN